MEYKKKKFIKFLPKLMIIAIPTAVFNTFNYPYTLFNSLYLGGLVMYFLMKIDELEFYNKQK